MLLHRIPAALALCCFVANIYGQNLPQDNSAPASQALQSDKPISTKWYENIELKGYMQFRYNRLLETNPLLRCDQCDKSWGKGQEFAFREARFIIRGDVHERVYMQIEVDHTSDALSTNKNFLQIRDAFFDYSFDKKKTFRLRLGESKVPFGFDNMQSSVQRIAFDRSDAINSAAPGERDFGAFFYYAPAPVRAIFKDLVKSGLKGSGDFGVLAIGLYNGESINKPELNDNLHKVVRLTYPFKIGRQILEPGIQAYSGKYTLAKDQLTAGVKSRPDLTYTDRRVAASLILYPQPFGIQAEYNWGESPSFDHATDSILVGKLHGGYITASYRTTIAHTIFTPYYRYQTYDGAKKHETDARMYHVRESEIGVEWQVNKNIELTLSYVLSHRQYENYKTRYDETGRLLRIQAQLSY
jgi:hypothetical protein